jgi:hypothetical protein
MYAVNTLPEKGGTCIMPRKLREKKIPLVINVTSTQKMMLEKIAGRRQISQGLLVREILETWLTEQLQNYDWTMK